MALPGQRGKGMPSCAPSAPDMSWQVAREGMNNTCVGPAPSSPPSAPDLVLPSAQNTILPAAQNMALPGQRGKAMTSQMLSGVAWPLSHPRHPTPLYMVLPAGA